MVSIGSETENIECVWEAEELEYLFNLVIETGVFSKKSRTSSTPIHKSGAKTMLTNYRPISLINNVGKILEK